MPSKELLSEEEVPVNCTLCKRASLHEKGAVTGKGTAEQSIRLQLGEEICADAWVAVVVFN